MARKRSALQPFSISFLDIVSCGFGAVILLFVLTSGKKEEYRNNNLSDVRLDVGALTKNIKIEEEDLKRLTDALKKNKDLIAKLNAAREDLDLSLLDKQNLLKIILTKRADIEESLALLLGELENLPKVEERPPIPIANPIRRQYLTDFKLDGDRVLFIIEASGGMLDISIDQAIERLSHTDEEKRKAPKWQRILRSVEWLITSLRRPTQYQILIFNRESEPLFAEKWDEWFDPWDRDTTTTVLSKLSEIVPQGEANLERAFFMAGSLDPLPDNIILLIDGLPTMAESVPRGSLADTNDRIRMFNAAKRQVPKGIPINIIMYPWDQDPPAAALFWLLACWTKGSFICPSKNWPNT